MYIREKIKSVGLELLKARNIFVILLLSLALFNLQCSHTAQRKRARTLVKKIEIGKTSQVEIKDLFGNPDYFGGRENKTWWVYVFVNEIGYKTLSLYFNEDGRVHDYYYIDRL